MTTHTTATIRKNKTSRRISRAAYLTLAVLPVAALFSAPVRGATTETWTGVAGDGSWATGTNWSTTAPVAGDSIVFGATTGATSTLTQDVNASFVALNFNAGAAAFTINPGTSTALTLTGALTDQSANGNLETFGAGLTVNGATLAISGGNNKLAFNNGATFTGALTDNSNSATADSIAVGAGKTLSLGGSTVIGAAAGTANTTTSFTVTGSSTSILTTSGNFAVGGGANTGSGTTNTVTVDLSGIGSFNMTGTTGNLSLGSGNQTNAVMTLGNTSNILNVASINVGNIADSVGGATNSTLPYTSTLHLGAGTNTLETTTLTIGNGPNGTLNFAGAAGTATISGLNGGTGTSGANITVGTGRDTTTVGSVQTSQLLLAGHNVTVNANILTLAINNQSAYNPGTDIGCVTFDTGTFNVQQMIIGEATQSHGRLTATFTLGTNSASTGILNVNSAFLLQDQTLTSADGNAEICSFIVNGGTANINTPILVAPGGYTSTANTTISFQGGTVNMMGHSIGANGTDTQGKTVTIAHVTMPGSGNTATIMNLGTTGNGTGTADGINGAGLTMNGAGTLILDGTNTYSVTTVSTGTLQVGAGSNTGTLGTGAVTDNANLTFNRSDTGLNVSDAISGNGTVKMVGTGCVTLSGSESYSGITQVSSGTLALSSASNNIASSSSININAAGTFDVTGVTGGFSLGSTQNIVNNGIVHGDISTSGSTLVDGTGTYANVTLNGGTFTAGNMTTIGAVSVNNLTVNSGNVLIKFSGSSADLINIAGSTNLSNSQITIGQLTTATPGTYTVISSVSALSNITAGALTSIGRTTFAVDSAITTNPDQLLIDVAGGPGNLTWQGTDPTSPTQWDNVQATHNWNGTAPAGDVTEFFDNDAVNFTGNAQGTIAILNTVNPGNMAVTAGNYTFSVGNIGGAGSLSVSGGCLTISTGANNTYSGGTNVTTGATLIVNSSSSLGSGPISVNSATLVVNGNSALNSALLTLNNATLDNTSNANVTNSFTTPVSVAGNITYLDSNNNADLSLGGGNVALTVSPTITVNGGNFTLGGVTSGNFGIIKQGAGNLILGSNSNTFTGGVVINAGSVQVTGTGGKTGLGGNANVTVNAGGTLIGAGGDAFGYTAGSAPQSILINGGTVTDLGTSSYRITLVDVHFTNGGTLTSNGSNTGNQTGNNTGQYSLFAGTVESDASANQALISAGNVSLQHGCTTFTVAQGTVAGGVDLLVSSNIVNYQTTAGSIIKTGLGTMELSGNNIYTGNTTVSQGTLMLASNSVNDNLSGSPVISVASGATLDVTQITTGGGFIMPASGNQTLSNSGTVAGNVTVQTGGIVTANTGGVFNGIVTANSGGTINGVGNYAGGVVVNGGTVTAGNATTIGALSMGSLSDTSGNVTFKFSGATADLYTVSGTASLANGQIGITQLSTVTPGSYVVLTAGTLAGLTTGQVAAFGRVIYTIDATALASNILQLDVTGAAAQVLWTGTDPGNPTNWDNALSAANWIRTDGGGGDTTHFYDGDSVTFDNTGVQGTINISGTVTPGSTTINSGNYSFSGGTLAGGALTINGGNITFSNTTTFTGGLTVTGGNTIFNNSTTFSGNLTVSNGSLTFNGTNTYTGVTTLNGGILIVNSLAAEGTAGGIASGIGQSGNAAANLVINGGELQYTGGTTSTDRLFTLGANGGTLSSTAGILTLSNTGAVAFAGTGPRTLNLNAGTSGSGGGVMASLIGDSSAGNSTSINITGNGTWTLSALNTYTGTTTVGAGATVRVTAGNTTTTGTSLGSDNGGNIIIQSGGTLDLGGVSGTTANTLNFGTRAVHIAGTGVNNEGAITTLIDGSNTALPQQNVFQNVVLDADASVGSSGTGSVGRMDIRSIPTGNLSATLDLQGHTLFKIGTSQLSLVGTNITSGNIDVQGGMLSLEVVTTTNGSGSITFENGTLSGFYDNGLTTGANTTVAGLTWPMIYKGNNIIGSGCTATTFVGAPIVLEGNVTLEPIQTNAGNATVNDLLTLGGNITEQGGSFSMTKLGIGTNFFGGSGSTYSGGLFVQEGTVALSGNNGLSPNSLVTMGSSGNNTTLDLAGFSTSIDGLTLASGATGTNIVTDSSTTASTLTFITATSTFGGVIQNGNGPVSLAVNSGSLDLTAANTYTGNTTVSGGTLTVDTSGSLASGNISVASTGTFTMLLGGSIPSTTNLTNNGTVNMNNPTRSIATLNSTTGGVINLNTTALTITTGGSYIGAINDNGLLGSLVIPSGATQTVGPVNVNAVSIGGNMAFTNTTTKTLSKVNSLTLAGTTGAWTGALDMTSSRLVVEDTSGNITTDIGTYKNMVANTNGNTAGIYSSSAALANTNAGHTVQVVAVVDNAVRLATDGASASNFGTGVGNVDANSILITAAYLGDANLDGVVDIKDLQVLANNWQKSVTDWSQGDFNGDGIVDIRDLQFIANDWQDGVGAPGAGSGESFGQALALLPEFGGTSSVPEPMSLAMLGLGGVVLASRRRHK